MRVKAVMTGLVVGTVLLLTGVLSLGQGVVISEVAWAGTAASPNDEWIELYNSSDVPVDLTGWTLAFGKVAIDLGSGETTVIEPGGYFLLERSDDEAVVDIAADLIYKGTLPNSGTVIKLLDPSGQVVDTANSGNEGGWFAGSAGGVYASMERIDPTGPDVPGNWRTNDGVHRAGSDAAGNPINGTPKAKNSATIAYETHPKVTVTAPAEEGEVITGLYLISWSACDPDGDNSALKIDIYLSSDGGENWNLLASGLANGGSYAWETTEVSDGENYRVKVVATDPDALSGEGDSPIFTVSNSG